MACPNFNLRTDGLSGSAETGGSWTLISGTYPGSLAGDNPAIVIADLGIGSNVFEYCFDPANPLCSEVCSQVILFKPNLGEGENSTVELCANGSSQVLINFIDGFVAGSNAIYSWSGSGTSSPGYNAGTNYNNSTFNPSIAGVGVYTFILNVEPSIPAGFDLLSCCEGFVIELEVTVVAAFDPGVGSNIVVC